MAFTTRDQSSCEANVGHSSLVLPTGYLDSVLRMRDDGRRPAKLQVKTAVPMLGGCTTQSLVSDEHTATSAHTCGFAPWQARRVTEFIDETREFTIRPRDCASQIRPSTNYFSHAFRQIFGTTASHYTGYRRIERARKLILLSNAPLLQVARACSFADQPYYCKVFRAVAGQSPGAWRCRTVNSILDE